MNDAARRGIVTSYCIRQRRKRLLSRDPYCYWCGQAVREVELKAGERPPDDAATVDHIRLPDGRCIKTVLACRACNDLRGRTGR